MSEVQDYSDYKEYWTKPKKVLAKRLDEPKSIVISRNGVEGRLDGETGDIHVIEPTKDGNDPKEKIFSPEQFEKKYGTGGVNGNLFDSEKKDS